MNAKHIARVLTFPRGFSLLIISALVASMIACSGSKRSGTDVSLDGTPLPEERYEASYEDVLAAISKTLREHGASIASTENGIVRTYELNSEYATWTLSLRVTRRDPFITVAPYLSISVNDDDAPSTKPEGNKEWFKRQREVAMEWGRQFQTDLYRRFYK